MEQHKNFLTNFLKGALIALLCVVLIAGILVCVKGPKLPGAQSEDAQLSAEQTSPAEEQSVPTEGAAPTEAPVQQTEPSVKPTEPKPTEPKPTEPKPTEPKPTEPKPTEPKPTEPKPTEPKPTEPKPTEPKPTEPKPTEPTPTEPAPTEPAPTEPAPTEPAPTEPEPTQPEQDDRVTVLTGEVSSEDDVVTEDVSMGDGDVSAEIPAGVQLEEDTSTLVLTITEKDSSDSGVELENDQVIKPLDVHMEGVSAENTQPITICLGKILPNGLNIGNVTLYHVEDDTANAMTRVMTSDELDVHNEFYYDPATGDITVAMASFSEVAMVSNESNPWNGKIDTSWYNDTDTEFEIFTADQLAGLGQLVDNGNTFDGKTIVMCLDIDLKGYKEDGTTRLSFNPIGYDYETSANGRVFKGTFDGNGNTISNLYQNGWDLGLSYSTAGGGLFASAVDADFKNLTLDNAYIVMECIDMGTLVGYAYGTCTYENIVVSNSVIANYNRYTGGVIGEVNGNHTLTNVDVDANTVVSALWGTFDPGIGGIIGGKYGNATITMTACDVACELDVYNDVTSAYQWYSYRRAGMLIGYSEESKTVNGRTEATATYLKTENCTVSYGDWVNYHYCEFATTNNPGYRYPFVRAEKSEFNDAYSNPRYGHPKDKDGNTITGEHEKSAHTDTEAHELEIVFNQLYGGGQGCYGGNGHIGDGVEVITAPAVVEKFTSNGIPSVAAESSITLGELFTASGLGEIKNFYVHAYVSPIDENTTARGTFNRNQNDWTKSTLTFTGTGSVTITINDYYFCEPTTIIVEVVDRQPVEKFENKFTGDFLYRVGNLDAVKLGSLFQTDAQSIGAVDVTVETVNGNATGTYTANSTWTNGTIQFNGTGVVKLTITDNDYCIPTELYLEVVSAYNVTAYSELKNRNSVLLCDITMSSGGKYSLYDYQTLYGNGFTFDVSAGQDSDTEGGYVGGNGTVWVRNSTLDNVVIIGEVYTKYGGTAKSEYNFPTVLVLGDSVIANSYISNGCAAVRVGSGCNLEMINTTLEGGIFANLDIRGGTVKLKDVVTINQTDKDGNSISNDQGVVGLGIVVYTGSTVTIEADGLMQYNCISENTTFTASEANMLKKAIFGTSFTEYQFNYEDAKLVNTGILSMVAEVKEDNFSALDGYIGKDASISSYDGYIYAPVPGTVSTPSEYVSSAQYQIAPSYKFNYSVNNEPQVSGSNYYCVYDEATQKYLISFDDGESFVWDAKILTLTKNDASVNYTVSVSEGASVNADNTITFDTAGDYTVTYRYTDPVNYRLSDGEIITYSTNYQKTVDIVVYEVVDTSAKTEFAFGNNGFRTEPANNLTYVMPDVYNTVDSNTAGIGVTSVGGVNIYYPIVSMHKSGSSNWYNYFSVFEAVTITDLDGTVHSTSSTELPSGLAVVGGFILDANGNVSTAESENGTGIFNYSTGKEIKCATYSTYGLCYYPDSQFSKTGTSDRAEQTIVAKYRYTDSNGTPYYYYVGYWCEEHTKQSVCVTPDTLVTLADGSQKRIDQITYSDQLLVWNFYTGEYDAAPASIIKNHGSDNQTIVTLIFDDGTSVKTINGHGFFHQASNEYVILDANNVASYVDHSFIKQDGTGYSAVKLVDFTITEEYTESWSVLTAKYYNAILEGLFTLTPAEVEGSPDYLMPFAVGEGLKYDEAEMQADIEQYGLYTYEDFAQYMTCEQFEALGLDIFKVSVGKGYLTWDDILFLIHLHIC